MHLIEQLREKKKEMGYNYAQLSELSGVPLGTVQKVLGGHVKNPRYETLLALEKALFPENGAIAGEAGDITEESAEYKTTEEAPVKIIPRDPSGITGHYHQYTAADREALPEERRTELIDGVLYDMASPFPIHQLIAGEIYRQLGNYIYANKGKCIPFIAPSDVRLDMDEWTVVQPDVYVMCDRDHVSRKRVMGAPDLVIEVLSASTRKKDMSLKLHKYSNAGVREYWLVDPDKSVIVYDLEHNMGITFYPFDAQVPVLIYGGKCIVDFKLISDYISSLKEE